MLVEGGECHGMEEGTRIGSLDEMCLLLSIAAVFVLIRLLLGKDDKESKLRKKRESRCESRMHSKKSSRSAKSSRSRKAEIKGRVFKGNDNLLTERDKQLDQLFEETLDRDIEFCKSSDRQQKKHEPTDR